MSESTYTFTRSQLVKLLEDVYCEGYHCGWKGDYGASEFLDDLEAGEACFTITDEGRAALGGTQ